MANPTMRPTTPELSAALIILYAKADETTSAGRTILFRALYHLTGLPMPIILRTWQTTTAREVARA